MNLRQHLAILAAAYFLPAPAVLVKYDPGK